MSNSCPRTWLSELVRGIANYRENAWQSGVLSGLIAGAVMGVMLTMQMRPVIEHAIPALWGLDGGAAGWTIHMINSAVFGVVFGALYPVILNR
ncbi:hypothetical protein [Haladaptatus cibarius]|uniref:hypothetical protein n=1 Tax=Haladaptatus cibarius TaxID=453847 RepID=UPI0006790518|nr:hypothetical protein [Haladaptatus cibarius]